MHAPPKMRRGPNVAHRAPSQDDRLVKQIEREDAASGPCGQWARGRTTRYGAAVILSEKQHRCVVIIRQDAAGWWRVRQHGPHDRSAGRGRFLHVRDALRKARRVAGNITCPIVVVSEALP
jgi:hypothetical protein